MRRTIFEEDHQDFRDSVRAFLLKEAVPHTERWEANGLVDRDFWTKAAQQGMVVFAAPEEHGGAGLSDFRFNAVIDEQVALTGAVGDNFNLTNDIAAPYFLDLTTPEQQGRWLPELTSGAKIPAIAMSEPGAGSDLRGLAATAVPQGDHYLLTGSKTFVTNGIQADLIIVAAYIRDGQSTSGMGLFVVESDMEGFSRGRKLAKVGRRAQDASSSSSRTSRCRSRTSSASPGAALAT